MLPVKRSMVRRDDCADELCDAYAFAERIANALAACVQLDAELSELHQARPSGEKLHLNSPEVVCRGELSQAKPSLKVALKLPAWQGGEDLWSIKQRVDPALFGMLDYKKSPGEATADWWRAGAEEAEKRRLTQARAEQQAEIEKNAFYGRR